jgi:hypothetical protein
LNISRKIYQVAILIYAAVTILAIFILLFTQPTYRLGNLNKVITQGPLSDIGITAIYLGLAWLLIGSILLLGFLRIISIKNWWLYSAFYFYAFLYVNFLRERIQYGDLIVYIMAAFNLGAGEPFYKGYLYPPLWATLLEPLTPLGGDIMGFIIMVINYLSLLLMFILLYLILKRYGFSRLLATMVVLAALCVNVPIIRTLGYVQVNFHVVNLIILSLLLFPRFILLSALALSLACHLKVSPLILVIPFILSKEWKWMIYFVLFTSGIILITSFLHGFEYYSNFIHNLVYNPYTEIIAFRDFSIDSFMQSTFTLIDMHIKNIKFCVWPIKLILAVFGFWIMHGNIKTSAFYESGKRESRLYNSVVVLIFLMLILSPIIWVHHGVFVILPFLILLKRIDSIYHLAAYMAAYILLFLVPTFDFYPLSYMRSLSIIICLILCSRLSKTRPESENWFQNINRFSINLLNKA